MASASGHPLYEAPDAAPKGYSDLLPRRRLCLQDPRCRPVAVTTQQFTEDAALRSDRTVDLSPFKIPQFSFPLLNQVNRSGLDGDSSRGDHGVNWVKIIDYDSVTAQRPGFLFQWLGGGTKI